MDAHYEEERKNGLSQKDYLAKHFRGENEFTQKRPTHVLQADDYVAGISLENS